MSEVKIITNNHPRPIVYGWELSDSERQEFDYYDADELDCAMFFRYKGEIYDLGEFMCVDRGPFTGWDGYSSDSFFSGILVKYPEHDNDHVMVGWYVS